MTRKTEIGIIIEIKTRQSITELNLFVKPRLNGLPEAVIA